MLSEFNIIHKGIIKPIAFEDNIDKFLQDRNNILIVNINFGLYSLNNYEKDKRC